jgi:antitoxin MazE
MVRFKVFALEHRTLRRRIGGLRDGDPEAPVARWMSSSTPDRSPAIAEASLTWALFNDLHCRSQWRRGEGPVRARVSRWGNSLAIRLPKAAVASLQVREGEPVDLVIEGDALLIRARRPHYRLEELVAAMRPEDQPELLDDVMSPPIGDEVL